jgi:serine/threonine protein phosphatase PrpC
MYKPLALMISPPESTSRVFQEQKMDRPQSFPLAGGEAAVYSARCPGKLTANEDGAVLLATTASTAVIAVADGVGGMPRGEKASQLVLATLANQVCKAAGDRFQRRALIVEGIDSANLATRRLGGGSTLCAIDIHGRDIRTFHVGDSAMMVVGGRGKIKLRSIPHSPVGHLFEMGMISEQEAMHHEERHLVLNVIGCEEMRIEIGPAHRIAPHDTLIVASDGLWDNLYLDEVAELALLQPLVDAVSQLAAAAAARMVQTTSGMPGKPDDLTIVAFRPSRRGEDRGRA